MKPFVHHLAGFDIRENWLTFEQGWSDERRTQYLFVEAIEKPLSADDLAWPSLLTPNGIFSLSHCDKSAPAIFELGETDCRGLNEPLWSDPAAMKRLMAKRWINPERPWCAIALTEFSTALVPSYNAFPVLGEAVPNALHDKWCFMGIDVCADMGQISGIMNCGYSPIEREYAAARWKNNVNRYHLFTEQSAANEFRAWTDNRVPEHAPFRLCGVFLVSISDASHPKSILR